MLGGEGRVRAQDLEIPRECYDHCATRPIEKKTFNIRYIGGRLGPLPNFVYFILSKEKLICGPES
jgi:hypothetical protein